MHQCAQKFVNILCKQTPYCPLVCISDSAPASLYNQRIVNEISIVYAVKVCGRFLLRAKPAPNTRFFRVLPFF